MRHKIMKMNTNKNKFPPGTALSTATPTMANPLTAQLITILNTPLPDDINSLKRIVHDLIGVVNSLRNEMDELQRLIDQITG